MPEKQDVIDSIENRRYHSNEVKNLVNSVRTTVATNYSDLTRPSTIKVGDVFIAQGGAKKRPYVVISVRQKSNIVIAVPLTTTDDELALTPFTSRFFGNGWFTSQLMTVKIAFVIENFAGVLENRAVIRKFKNDLKQFYKGLL